MIEEMIDENLRKEAEASKRDRDCFHVSELSSCLRGVYLQREGAKGEMTARQLRIFEVGHMTEDFMIKHLGDRVKVKQAEVSYPEYDLKGSCDAIIEDDGPTLLECKSQHSRSFWWIEKRGGGAMEHHVQQTALYWAKLKEEYPKLKAKVVYFSKDDLAMKEIMLTEGEMMKAYEGGIYQAALLFNAWKDKVPPPPEPAIVMEDGKASVNWKAKYCPVHDRCLNDPFWLKKAEEKVESLNKGLKKGKAY